jgi:hypothetical protein
MAKRLQVILQDPEYREIQKMARSRRMSLAEWVRQALDLARHASLREIPARKSRSSARPRNTTIPRATSIKCWPRSEKDTHPAHNRDPDRFKHSHVFGWRPHPHKMDAQRLLEKLISKRQEDFLLRRTRLGPASRKRTSNLHHFYAGFPTRPN